MVLGIIDSEFARLERSNPYLAQLLKQLNADLDAVIRRNWPANGGTLKTVLAIVDGEFARLERLNPIFYGLLKVINAYLDTVIRKHWPA